MKTAITPNNTLVAAQRRRHWEMLAIACFVVLASLVLEVHPDGRVGLAGAPRLLLPPLCLPQEWFGLRCPGCGLTRSFVYLADGNWSASLEAHRLGWLVAAAVVVQAPYRLHALWRPGRLLLSPCAARCLGNGLIAALILYWLLEMLLACG
jgi:hypothetical protein